jgi:hypothetical protein
MLRLFPLSLFAWPAFCPAYTPLDKNPVFSRFLKTITMAVFFFLWFYPFSSPRDYIILVPPLAVLSGMNYWLLARRLGFRLHSIFRLVAYAGLACSALVIIFYSIPTNWWSGILMMHNGVEFRNSFMLMGICIAALASILLLYLLKAAPMRCPLWLNSLGVVCAAALLYWSAMYPYQSFEKRQKELAKQIRDMMGADFHEGMTIYKEPNIGLYALCVYMQCGRDEWFPWFYRYEKIKIRKIRSYKDIQGLKSEIFIFSDDVPVLPGRTFTKIPVNEQKKIYLYKFSSPAPAETESK